MPISSLTRRDLSNSRRSAICDFARAACAFFPGSPPDNVGQMFEIISPWCIRCQSIAGWVKRFDRADFKLKIPGGTLPLHPHCSCSGRAPLPRRSVPSRFGGHDAAFHSAIVLFPLLRLHPEHSS